MPSGQCDDDAIGGIFVEMAGKLGTGDRVDDVLEWSEF